MTVQEVRRVRLGEIFSRRQERGKAGFPTMSVTLNGGLVERTSLDRKTESNLNPEDHLMVRRGDIAYNTMRMWQGASGLAAADGIVSPAYVVVKPCADVDSRFASYWFKSAWMIHQFWAYSYGLTEDRLRLYYEDFARIPVSLPTEKIQRLIVEALSAWDKAIILKRLLIAKKKARHIGILQTLLGPIRQGSWKTQKLGDMASVLRGNGLSKDALSATGRKCILYGELFTTYGPSIGEVASRTTETGGTPSKIGDILVPGSTTTVARDLATASAIFEDGVALGGDINIIRPKRADQPDAQFLAYYLSFSKARDISRLAQGTTIIHLHPTELRSLKLQLPILSEQRRISSILCSSDREIALHNEQLKRVVAQRESVAETLFRPVRSNNK